MHKPQPRRRRRQRRKKRREREGGKEKGGSKSPQHPENSAQKTGNRQKLLFPILLNIIPKVPQMLYTEEEKYKCIKKKRLGVQLNNRLFETKYETLSFTAIFTSIS